MDASWMLSATWVLPVVSANSDVGFSVIVLRMRGEVVELLKAGVGAKLMGTAALLGLALAILTTVKPEPASR